MILPGDDQTAKIMQPGKQTLDFPTPTVAAQLTAILRSRFAAVVLVRSNQLDALLLQLGIQRITIISAVTDQSLRRGRGKALFDGGGNEASFMRRSACNPHGDRKTMAVRNCHDLGPFAAACWTNCTAPFFAPAKVASINVSPKSNCPRANRSSAKARNGWTSVPPRTHGWKRRWQVWYGGNLSPASPTTGLRFARSRARLPARFGYLSMVDRVVCRVSWARLAVSVLPTAHRSVP